MADENGHCECEECQTFWYEYGEAGFELGDIPEIAALAPHPD